MQGQRRRRWINIKPALIQWADTIYTTNKVWVANTSLYPTLGFCWPAVYDVGPTLPQHWVEVLCLLRISLCWKNDTPMSAKKPWVVYLLNSPPPICGVTILDLHPQTTNRCLHQEIAHFHIIMCCKVDRKKLSL